MPNPNGPACPRCGAPLTPATAGVDLVGATDAAHDPGGTGRLDLIVTCDHCGCALGAQLQLAALIALHAGNDALLDDDRSGMQNAENGG